MRSGQGSQQTTWDEPAIAEKVMEILRTRSYSPVSLDSTFESLGLDSLAMAETVFEIETAFGIRTDNRLLEVHTVADVVRYVRSALERQQVG